MDRARETQHAEAVRRMMVVRGALEKRKRWLAMALALAGGVAVVYLASGVLRAWLVHTIHGR